MEVNLQRGRVVAVGDRVRQGSMQPTYMDVSLADGSRVSAICKFPTRENRAPSESVINEWFGCFSAHLAGIQVPPCYVVEASPPVMLHLIERHGVTAISPFGFASKVSQIDSIVFPHTLNSIDSTDLMRLFCFDMLFVNADRTQNNPNCGHSKHRLFAYDFGSSLVSPKTPPNHFDKFFFGSGLIDRASAHLCRDHVSSPALAETVLTEMIDKVCKNRWYSGISIKSVPQHLQDQFILVTQYLDYLTQERNMICRQIVSTV